MVPLSHCKDNIFFSTIRDVRVTFSHRIEFYIGFIVYTSLFAYKLVLSIKKNVKY